VHHVVGGDANADGGVLVGGDQAALELRTNRTRALATDPIPILSSGCHILSRFCREIAVSQ